jgi:hypothetical protein
MRPKPEAKAPQPLRRGGIGQVRLVTERAVDG